MSIHGANQKRRAPMAELTPEELDQLEDALGGLEGDVDLDALGLPAHLTGRLHDYREVLAVTREALPLEDPRGDPTPLVFE